MLNLTQPSKEQVRAYMAQREHACRPPPRPEEIRRLLGWCYAGGAQSGQLPRALCLPQAMGQLGVLLALEWTVRLMQPPGHDAAEAAA